eukprot:UN01011
MKVANLCCEGRIVSCLEGGYRIHGGLVSPFARSVAAHVRALNEGGSEPWSIDDCIAEIQLHEELHRDKQLLHDLRSLEASRKLSNFSTNTFLNNNAQQQDIIDFQNNIQQQYQQQQTQQQQQQQQQIMILH